MHKKQYAGYKKHFRLNCTNRLKVKGWKKYIPCKKQPEDSGCIHFRKTGH